MSELTFCKTFLGAIDSRPVKLSSDYVSDARTYPATGVVSLSQLFLLNDLLTTNPARIPQVTNNVDSLSSPVSPLAIPSALRLKRPNLLRLLR